MSNIIPFRQAEFVNIDGKPVGVTMKQLVLRYAPKAWVHHRMTNSGPSGEQRDFFTIRVPEFDSEPPECQCFIGTGATEEAAWRDAYFNGLKDSSA